MSEQGTMPRFGTFRWHHLQSTAVDGDKRFTSFLSMPVEDMNLDRTDELKSSLSVIGGAGATASHPP